MKAFLDREITLPFAESKLRKPKSIGLPSSEVLKDVAHQLGNEIHHLKLESEDLKLENSVAR
jgi:hypothetical protein